MKKKEVQKNNLSKIDDLKTIQEFKSNQFDLENRNYKPAEKTIEDIDFDEDIGLEGVVDLTNHQSIEIS